MSTVKGFIGGVVFGAVISAAIAVLSSVHNPQYDVAQIAYLSDIWAMNVERLIAEDKPFANDILNRGEVATFVAKAKN